MILINKYTPEISSDTFFLECEYQYKELTKIFEFIDLPANIKQLEATNSAILRNYYSHLLDDSNIELKTVKYLVNKNLRASNIQERAIEQYHRAEQFLLNQLHQPLSIAMLYETQKIAVEQVYETGAEVNLFNHQNVRRTEVLHPESEAELESLFEFLNSDNEFHPIVQGWMLHFKMLSLPLFTEGKSRLISLIHQFWLAKHKMNLYGLLCLEQEIFQQIERYKTYQGYDFGSSNGSLSDQINFGLQIQMEQLLRLKDLLRTYFRKQVDFEKLNPKQKNIMNYVFERGYKLKEIDETILNKRQKLIMYIVQHKGFVSTKELVSEFDCNRKTIQRDFTLLLELGLVKSIGAGAGLRYCINLEEKENPQLEIYQADFIKNRNTEEAA